MDLSSILTRLDRAEREIERLRSLEVHGAPKLRLDYNQSSDIWNATSIGAGSTTSVLSSQDVTISAGAALVAITLNIGMLVDMAVGHVILARIVWDGVAQAWQSPQIKQVGSGIGAYVSPIGGTAWIDSVAAGTYGCYAQVYNTGAATFYLRAGSVGIYEHLTLRAVEFPK